MHACAPREATPWEPVTLRQFCERFSLQREREILSVSHTALYCPAAASRRKVVLIVRGLESEKAANHNFQSLPKHPFWQTMAQFFSLDVSHAVRLTRVRICCVTAREFIHKATMKRNLFSPSFLSRHLRFSWCVEKFRRRRGLWAALRPAGTSQNDYIGTFRIVGEYSILTRPPKLHENSLQFVIPLHGARRRRETGQKHKKNEKLTTKCSSGKEQ